MICKLLVACLALVPVAILADNFYLFGCGDFERMLDGNAGTQQGMNKLTEFFSSGDSYLYLWDPSPIESTQSCNYIKPTLTAGVGTFSYHINNASKTYTGTMKYVLYPHPHLELNSNLPEAFLGATNKGHADWYPVYISSTDLAVIACRNVVFGRRESIYVFTNQNYTGLNSACAANAISTAIKKKVKAIPSVADKSPMCG